MDGKDEFFRIKNSPHIVYQELTYLKPYNKFYEDMFIGKSLSSQDMFKFSDIGKIQGWVCYSK